MAQMVKRKSRICFLISRKLSWKVQCCINYAVTTVVFGGDGVGGDRAVPGRRRLAVGSGLGPPVCEVSGATVASNPCSLL